MKNGVEIVNLNLSFWILSAVASLAAIGALIGVEGKAVRAWIILISAALFVIAILVVGIPWLRSIHPAARDLGGMNLSAWCQSQNRGNSFLAVRQHSQDAIDHWQCDDGHRITKQDMLAACRMLYGDTVAFVECSNASDAYSCRCFT